MLKKLFICFTFASFLFQSIQAFAISNLTYSYDANGNLVQGDGKYFEYNDANKLVRVRMENANGPVIAKFFYDHSGQRVKKIENGVKTYYVGKHFDKVVDGNSPGETAYYFAELQRVAKKNHNDEIIYFHLDHLGSISAATTQSEKVTEKSKHYPFGNIRKGSEERYTYTGKEKDASTDYHYFEARHFSSKLRQFTQADIIIPDYYFPQSLNRYTYAMNNPIIFVDKNGHIPILSVLPSIFAPYLSKLGYNPSLSIEGRALVGPAVQAKTTLYADIENMRIDLYQEMSGGGGAAGADAKISTGFTKRPNEGNFNRVNLEISVDEGIGGGAGVTADINDEGKVESFGAQFDVAGLGGSVGNQGVEFNAGIGVGAIIPNAQRGTTENLTKDGWIPFLMDLIEDSARPTIEKGLHYKENFEKFFN